MNEMNYSALIEPEELLSKINQRSPVKIIDGTFVMPGKDQHPVEKYQRKRIGKAVFFDIDEIAEKGSDLPHMLPSQDEFADAVGKMGISRKDEIVIYGQDSLLMGPCRVWWMFGVFGHENVRVLNGSLGLWEKLNYPVNTHLPENPVPDSYTSAFNPEKVKTFQEIKEIVKNKSCQIIDARSCERFSGEAPEPRPGLKSGHIPGSINIPCSELVDDETGKMKSPEKLNEIFTSTGIYRHKPVITTCGSGVTACAIALALHETGIKNISVYDGSWSEWGREI
jgi:thiosulfate/3-mercaptopyruvate sulfurtransferase